MKANIKQISEMSGFSPATVSNALNNKRSVNSKTYKKIWEIAESVGYQIHARMPKIRFVIYRKNGLIIDENPFFSEILQGVGAQAGECGCEIVFTYIDCREKESDDQVNEVLEDRDSLLIVLGTEMQEEDLERFREKRDSMILLDSWSDREDFDAVLINNTDAAWNAVRYLWGKGHKKIGYLRGEYRIKAFQYREYGFYRALEEKKAEVDQEFIITLGTRLDSAYEGMKNYLDSHTALPDAFFADNDIIALGAMRALTEKGISVPSGVSIIGFDDLKFSAVSQPGLTTIRVFQKELAKMAVRRVLEKNSQDRFHPGQKLGHVKGLDNIVLGPQFQPLHPVGHRRPGGDEDHRKLQGLEVFQKGEAIGAGKHDVHQGQVIVPGSRQVRGLIPIWGMVAEIAGRL